MAMWKRGSLKVRMTAHGPGDALIHLQLESANEALPSSDFHSLIAWFDREGSRLAQRASIKGKKHPPIFALGEIVATSGENLNLLEFGMKDVYVRVVSLRPLRVEDRNGKVWSIGLGLSLRKLTLEEEDRLSHGRIVPDRFPLSLSSIARRN